MDSKMKIIQPSGIFDGTQGRKIHEEISLLIASGINDFMIDFKTVHFMDSSGFGSLLLILKKVQKQQGNLVICGINAQIKMIFDISGTADIFNVIPDQDSFMPKVIQH
jgi:anti-anti-sigma factor